MPRSDREGGAPRVLLVAHWDWVLHQFRMPIARGLREAGYDVHLVSPTGPYVQRMRDEGFPWHEWQVSRRSLNPVREILALLRLLVLYRRLRPRVVHHFTVKPNLYGSIAARLTRVPVRINVFSGLGFVFSEAADAGVVRRVTAPIMGWAFRGAWTVVLNDADRDELLARSLVDEQRVVRMPEGVDSERFRPPEAGSAHDGVVALTACRLLRTKGMDTLVDAARELQVRAPGVHIVIAGEPDEGNPDSVTAQDLAGWEALPNVTFVGPSEHVDELLRDADVAVLPTRYQEGAPRFLMEAAATGVPAIASDIPGCREVVDEETGVLVPVGDVGALVVAIERLAGDAALRARLGAAGRHRAETRFAEHRLVSAHLALYGRALSRRLDGEPHPT